MVNIPNYGTGIPDELVLGYISWYTVTHPKVPHDDIVKWVDELGLSPTILSKNPPRTGDAFKRACRYSEVKGIAIPGTDNTANIMVRKVATTPSEVERHMVVEVVDPTGRRLEYHDFAEMVLDRKQNVLRVTRNSIGGSIKPILDDAIELFQQNFHDALTYVDPQVLRRMIRTQLKLMSAISVRHKGSVYYFPAKYREQGEALEEFCRRLGSGSGFHTLPLVNTAKQREMVKAAFQQGVHEDAQQLIVEMRRIKNQGKKVSAGAIADMKRRVDHIESLVADYESLIQGQLTQAVTESKMLKKELVELLTSGMVE